MWQELCNSTNPRSVGERLVVTIQQHEQKDCNSDRQQQQNVGQVDAETHHVWSGSRRTWKEETGTSRTSRIWKTQKGIGQFFTIFLYLTFSEKNLTEFVALNCVEDPSFGDLVFIFFFLHQVVQTIVARFDLYFFFFLPRLLVLKKK